MRPVPSPIRWVLNLIVAGFGLAMAGCGSLNGNLTFHPEPMAPQTISFGTIPTQILGTTTPATVTLTATASSGLPVSFTSSTPTICTVSGTTATLIAVGTCTIEANQAGNATFVAAPEVGQSFAVSAEPLTVQTITFGTIPTQMLGTTTPATVNLTATASSGLPVSFTSSTPAVCTVSGTTATLIAVGTCTIEASQAGNTVFAPAPEVGQSFAVTPALQSQTITFGTIPAQTLGATPPTTLTLSATASSGLPVSFTSSTPTVCTVSGTTATLIIAGTCTIQATQPGNSTYAAATPVTQSFVVTSNTLLPQSLAFSPPAGTYSATQTVTITESAPGATIYYTTNGTAPTTASTLYNGPITVSSSETLEAMAVATSTTVAAAASATYTISANIVGITISPTTVSLAGAAAQVFTATVTGSANTAVSWSATCGTLSGPTTNPVTYTAPSLAENCIVTATSAADHSKTAQAAVTVTVAGTVNIVVTPPSSSIPINGQVQITATVTGSANTAVTWTSDAGNCGTLSNTTTNTVTYAPVSATNNTLYDYPICQGGSTGNVSGSFTITANSVANPADSATAVVLVDPGTGGNYPPIPYPVAAHPRIWVTPTDVTRLQSWAVSSNPIYSQGTLPMLQGAITVYNNDFFPGGQPNSNWPDPGDTQGYSCNSSYTFIVGTSCLTEENALIFAFNSLIDPSSANRITYAQYARNLIMYAMDQAVQGFSPGLPFRDPSYPTYNHASATMHEWPLVVDWIYNAQDANGNNILTAADKATIRNVFLLWSGQEVNVAAVIAAPSPEGVVNSLQLLPNNLPFRFAANNYYLAHARNVTMMALSIDPSDDPPVDPTQSSSQIGNSLRSYILEGTGAFLYQEYAMFGDPQAVATAYGIPGNGTGLGLTSGGLPAEGMLYGESYGFMFGQFLALQTAGFNRPAYASYTGPQIALLDAPVWDRYVKGMFSSLIPTSFVPSVASGDNYLGSTYEYSSYGDMLRLWVTPDNISGFSLLSFLENENGQTTHQADARWFVTNVLSGGAPQLTGRVVGSTAWGLVESLEYYMLFDPTAAPDPDPRPTFPLLYYDPGMARIVAHNNWNPDSSNTMFTYRASWESIYHQDGNAGSFDFFRGNEWLTKEMNNYDNNSLGLTSYYLNSLALKNICPTCPGDTPPLQDYENGEWANGSQFILGDNAGDPTTMMSSGTGYVFAATDMTNLYNRMPDVYDPSTNSTDIIRAQRSIFWLNSDYIVIYDRATSHTSGLFKTFNLSLITNPVIGSQEATETMADGQQLFIHTLLPLNATITARYAAGDLNPIADLEPTQYVMTVQDASLPTDTRFLHVLQGADQGAAATPVSSFNSSSGTEFDGALVGNSALLFIHDETQTAGFTSTVYSEPSTVTTNYVAGLTPNAPYSVTKTVTGNTIQVTVAAGGSKIADAAGVLVF